MEEIKSYRETIDLLISNETNEDVKSDLMMLDQFLSQVDTEDANKIDVAMKYKNAARVHRAEALIMLNDFINKKDVGLMKVTDIKSPKQTRGIPR